MGTIYMYIGDPIYIYKVEPTGLTRPACRAAALTTVELIVEESESISRWRTCGLLLVSRHHLRKEGETMYARLPPPHG